MAATRASLIKEPLALDESFQGIAEKVAELQDEGKHDEAIELLSARLRTTTDEEISSKVTLELMIGDLLESRFDDAGAHRQFLSAKNRSDCLRCTGERASMELELVANVLGRIAASLYALGSFTKSAAYFQKSKALIARVYFETEDRKMVRIASLDNNIAACIAAELPAIRCDDAISKMAASLEVLTAILGSEHPRPNVVQYNLQKESSKSIPE